MMDPIGFTLENFDAIGHWRSIDGGGKINASGALVGSGDLEGPADLVKALAARPEQFVRTMTEMLLTYSLGRGLEYYDMPVVRAITREAAKNDYRFSSLVLGIVKSPPFLMNTKALQNVAQVPELRGGK